MASWARDRRWQHARGFEVSQRHGAVFSPAHSAAVSRSLSERRRAEVRRGAGDGIRDRYEQVVAAHFMAERLRGGMQGEGHAALCQRGLKIQFRTTAFATGQ